MEEISQEMKLINLRNQNMIRQRRILKKSIKNKGMEIKKKKHKNKIIKLKPTNKNKKIIMKQENGFEDL